MPLITVSKEVHEFLRELAFRERKSQKTLVEEAIKQVYK